ncbi:DTW domain-containing protein [Proteus vulgaris]|uniref:tRNA-uridine aminocarboxypropyltransferase n=1 Tax=Proteus vulgaris TaxID=585 RepID=UPI0018E3FC0F|nr:tRNA-uridine aminocarboxypropyltransferase [Proteus vulgaris]MBI6528949.1 DTW domain-containing protein [Proteus vulgaris]
MHDNAVSRLRQYRLSVSTRPFKARGFRIKRCNFCLLPEKQCLCDTIVSQPAKSQFCLLMYDTEVMKPSNTGKLIADVLPDTQAFLWSRTTPEQALLDLINTPDKQAYVVFPESYASNERVVYNQLPVNSKPPLFILLDGTWSEARKMFRKSPYLDSLPIFSLNEASKCDYVLRQAAREDQHCTAEVAASILENVGDINASQQLFSHFSYFRQQYLIGKPDRRQAKEE